MSDRSGFHVIDGKEVFVLDFANDSSAKFSLISYMVSVDKRGETTLADEIAKKIGRENALLKLRQVRNENG